MDISESIYSSSQSTSLKLGTERLPGLKLFWFEGASLDAREQRQASEDFITYKYKGGNLAFIVCDGVQQSVDSNVAARLFGTRIVEMLSGAKGNKKSIENFSEKLRSEIDQIILDMPVDPNSVPEFYLRARREVGAQVKFTCGVIDRKEKRIDLYWAGDVRFAVYDKKGKIIFSWEKDNGQFWSTRGDYSLNLDSVSWSFESVSRISVTSDGIREDFNRILAGKLTLDDHRLVQHRYDIGVDDISGFDALIEHDVNLEKLQAVRDVRIADKKLVWAEQEKVDKYRIYHSSNDGSLNLVAELSAPNNSYELPFDPLNNEDLFVQAISSRLISSDLSKAVSYKSAPDAALASPKANVLLGKDTIKSKIGTSESVHVSSPRHEVRPRQPWIKFALGCTGFLGVLLVFSVIGFSVFRGYFFVPTLKSYVATKTPVPSTPSFTAVPTITASVITPDLLTAIIVGGENSTPSSTLLSPTQLATPDINLSECQNGFLTSEPYKWKKYKIQPGNTLYQLADRYNTSVGELMRVNCFQTSNISSGDYMLIPNSDSN